MVLDSRWVNIDGVLGVVALTGEEGLVVDRASQRRAGKYDSLYVEEICLGREIGARRVKPGEMLLEAGFAVLAGADAAETANFQGGALALEGQDLRGLWAEGADGRKYSFIANFGSEAVEAEVGGQQVKIPAGEARLVTE